ncbi:MAG: metalloregulator ArsR/SmtB family transcription factor [Pseudomonadota bacterium]|nr:metalloregulator ArsR/SmtB family transcription factor [Pseudomonadota bacterium]
MNKSLPSRRVASPAPEVPVAALAGAAADAAVLLKALANPDRLLLLCHLVEDECNVSALETLTGIRQPTLSQQLGVLREEGLVGTRREGKFIFYRIASAPALAVLRTLYETFCRPVATPRPRRRPSTTQESRR